MLKIKAINDEKVWERFIAEQSNTTFVQAPAYGDFYKSIGENYWIFGVYDNDRIVGGSLVVSVHARRGDFLYLPYGPILDDDIDLTKVDEALDIFYKYLKAFAEDRKYDFIRVSPFVENSKHHIVRYRKNGFRSAPMHILAETTWMLDVKKSEEKLLREMKKNHRNLINRCKNAGVKIVKSTNAHDLAKLDKLLTETAHRHKFVRFSQEYIEKEFQSFSDNDNTALFLAYLPDGTLDSAAVIMFYAKMAAYRHSASINSDKRLPTSYLLQWEIIKEVKRRGISKYNFWGIAPDNASSKHPFYGISHFKKGFGGEKQQLIHCQDMPLTAKYWLNWSIETLRRLKRGF